MAALWSPSGMWSLAPACRGPQPASMLAQVYSGRRKPPRHAVPRRMLAAVAGLVLALMVLASTTPQHAEAYGVGNRTLDKSGRLTHLRFLHIPKTGTSFIMVLRNYLAGECRQWLAAGSGLLAVPWSVMFRKENCRDMECLRHVNVLPRPPPSCAHTRSTIKVSEEDTTWERDRKTLRLQEGVAAGVCVPLFVLDPAMSPVVSVCVCVRVCGHGCVCTYRVLLLARGLQLVGRRTRPAAGSTAAQTPSTSSQTVRPRRSWTLTIAAAAFLSKPLFQPGFVCTFDV